MWPQYSYFVRESGEDTFLGLGDDLTAFLYKDQRMEVGGVTSSILYNYLRKVIITLRF